MGHMEKHTKMTVSKTKSYSYCGLRPLGRLCLPFATAFVNLLTVARAPSDNMPLMAPTATQDLVLAIFSPPS